MSAGNPTKFIEHIVLFKVKGEIDAEKNAAVVNNLNILSTVETSLYQIAGPIRNLRSPSRSYTHMSYMRFATDDHLREFATHPIHVGVQKEIRHHMEDVMAVDWWHSAETATVPPGSAVRVSLLKLKEEEKGEVLGFLAGMKEKFPAIQSWSFGENISPARGKGFSVASVAVFKDAGELEKGGSEWDAVIGGKVEEAMVFDYVTAA